MSWTGEVEFTILDGQAGVFSGPVQSVQAVIGCSESGTVGLVVPTRSPATLFSTFENGPLAQAAAMAVQAGGTVLAVRATTATVGSINNAGAVGGAITGATNATPIVITTTTAHNLVDGDVVTVASVGGNTGANGTFMVDVTGSTTFILLGSVGNGAYTSGGTTTRTGTIMSRAGSGTSELTFTGTPTDDYYIITNVLQGGTVGTDEIIIEVSMDAGRTFGPQFSLGTSTTYALADSDGFDSGMTLNISAGILSDGDTARVSTTGPQPNTAGIGVCLAALKAYAASSGAGWGSIHILGITSGSEATTIESGGSTNLDGLATNDKIFTRAIVSARDATLPAEWGGAGETEAAWMASLRSDFQSTNARRLSCGAGYYNTTAPYPTQIASTPSYRRPLAWSYAAREVAIPPQRHAGRVVDGPLAPIVVNATSDPADGFLYHNEALNPGLDYFIPGGSGRFTTARTHNGRTGFYITNPLSLAPIGSDFALLPLGLVMDVACALAQSALQQFINADLQAANNGTLLDKDAQTVYQAVWNAINTGMLGLSMISGFTVAVDQTQNILVTKKLVVTITILGRAYILEVDVTLGYATQLVA